MTGGAMTGGAVIGGAMTGGAIWGAAGGAGCLAASSRAVTDGDSDVTAVSAGAGALAGSAVEDSIAYGVCGGGMTLAAGAAVVASLPDLGCPQAMQKLLSGATVAPHDLQTALDEDVDGEAGVGAVSSMTAGCAIL